MKILKVKKIPKEKVNPGDLISRICYYYPQYNYTQARRLPYKRVMQLLKVADQERAKFMIDILRIVIVPNSKDKNDAKNLFNEFKERLN